MGKVRSEEKSDSLQDFSSTYLHMQDIKMETKKVYCNIVIDEAAFEIVKGFIEELGGQIAEEKQLKFEDLGLAEIEGQRGHYQCLVCSSTFNRKGSAVFHFKKFHIKQTDLKIRCPRWNAEIHKSSLNSHMEQVHKVKKFNQLLKRSFQPSAARNVPSSSQNIPTKIAKVEEQLDLLDLDPNDENNNVKFEEQPNPFGLVPDDENNNVKSEDNTTKNAKQKPGEDQADRQYRIIYQLYVNMF